MRPGGLGSTQLIQKLAQLAWYWWPPYISLKLSVSELKACPSERGKYQRRDLQRRHTLEESRMQVCLIRAPSAMMVVNTFHFKVPKRR